MPDFRRNRWQDYTDIADHILRLQGQPGMIYRSAPCSRSEAMKQANRFRAYHRTLRTRCGDHYNEVAYDPPEESDFHLLDVTAKMWTRIEHIGDEKYCFIIEPILAGEYVAAKPPADIEKT